MGALSAPLEDCCLENQMTRGGGLDVDSSGVRHHRLARRLDSEDRLSLHTKREAVEAPMREVAGVFALHVAAQGLRSVV